MEIDPHFILHETEHWIVNHHLASALPGYLMLGTKVQTNSLAELSTEALAELGGLIARTQQIYAENPLSSTDGAELTLFVWREFGENPTPPAIQGCSVEEVIEELRSAFK